MFWALRITAVRLGPACRRVDTKPGHNLTEWKVNMVETKHCSRCDHDVPVAAFHKRAAASDGLQGRCRSCARESHRAWRDERRTVAEQATGHAAEVRARGGHVELIREAPPKLKRGPKPVDLTGQRFGRLIVVGQSETRPDRRGARWACQCDCGGCRVVSSDTLKRGQSHSCGCLRRELTAERNRERATA